VVGVRAWHAVLAVLERLTSRHGGTGHGSQRTPARALAAAALVTAFLTPGIALTGSSSPAAADDKTTFTLGILSEVDSFNPFLGVQAEAYEAWALNYDFLVGYSMKDISPQPELATKWTPSKDGLTWTLDIREGVKWSDGQPLTAKDVAYTLSRIIDGGPEAVNYGTYLKGATSATATDDTHVVLKLSKPIASLPLLPIPIVPEHIWKNVSEDDVKSYAAEPENGQPVVGSGPFSLVEGTAGGSTYRFERNPYYWGPKPHIDEVVFRVYKSADPMVQALIKGEIDFAEDISPLQVKSLEGKQGITTHFGNGVYFDEIAFNTGAVDPETGQPKGDGNPALQDPKFRHALGYALDNQVIADKVYQGAAEAGQTIIPPSYSEWRWAPSGDQAFTFDLDKAGQLLDEAGYKVGSDGLRTMPDGSPLGTLRLAARSDASSDTSVNTMDYFKEWLDELGIKAEVVPYTSGRLTEVILDGNYDAFEWGWYVEADPDGVLSYFTCDERGGLSDSWYCTKKYDRMYEQQHHEMDHAKRVALVQKMQQMVFEASPYLVTVYPTTGEAVRSDRFACFQPQPDPGGVWLIQYGGHNYTAMRPADQAGDCDGVTSAVGASAPAENSGGSSMFWAWTGVAVVVLAGAGGFVLLRRRATVGERE
jgi:peptide/nickel transport system substrate-binding protein